MILSLLLIGHFIYKWYVDGFGFKNDYEMMFAYKRLDHVLKNVTYRNSTILGSRINI